MKYGRYGGSRVPALLLVLAALLAGCRGRQEDPAAQAAEYYRGLEEISARMALQTDSGVVMEYGLAVEWTREGSRVTVLSPQEIAGVQCLVTEQGSRLAYPEVELETLLPGLPGFTPVSCLDGMLDALANASPTEWAWEEKQGRQCLALTYELELEGIQAARQVWLEQGSLAPVWAEWYLEGDQIMHAGFQSFEGR